MIGVADHATSMVVTLSLSRTNGGALMQAQLRPGLRTAVLNSIAVFKRQA